MTDTTLKNAFLSAGSVNPVLKTVSNTQSAAQTKAGKTQDFGAVLDKTAQKMEQKSVKTEQPAAKNSDNAKAQQTEKADAQQPEEKTADAKTDTAVEETGASTEEAAAEAVSEETAVTEPDTELSKTKEPVDQMTIDEIANALEQIMSQIKEILGITDEELLSGMQKLDLQPYDLLASDNMTQLVTAIAGEDSAISLVANEELYTALQELVQMVDTQADSLLENTNLTGEELKDVLQKLQELERQTPVESKIPAGEGQTELKPESEIEIKIEAMETEVAGSAEDTPDEPVNGLTDTPELTQDSKEQPSTGPVIIREDNTRPEDQPTKQYDKLPENQQENPTQLTTKPQTQDTGRDAKDSDTKDSRNFGQNGAAQNFQNNLGEMNSTAAVTEGIAKFTSESTENIMRQLADMVKIVKNENLTEMELQLHPASLGTVNVSLTTKGGMVTAEFTTQNEAVKAAIEAQATQLRTNLEEQGVKIEAIEVSVESHQMERDLDKNGDREQRQAQEQETNRIQGMRRSRSSINLRAFASGEELDSQMQGADDATRIAMEMMAANGNTMDLLA